MSTVIDSRLRMQRALRMQATRYHCSVSARMRLDPRAIKRIINCRYHGRGLKDQTKGPPRSWEKTNGYPIMCLSDWFNDKNYCSFAMQYILDHSLRPRRLVLRKSDVSIVFVCYEKKGNLSMKPRTPQVRGNFFLSSARKQKTIDYSGFWKKMMIIYLFIFGRFW